MSAQIELKSLTSLRQWKYILRRHHTAVIPLHRRSKSCFVLIFASLVLVSCGSSSSSSVTDSTNNSVVDVTNSTIALMANPAIEEFGPIMRVLHITFVRNAMSADVNYLVTDSDIVGAAQNVCYQMQTRGMDAWVEEVDSKRATDSSEEWAVRVASTLGAAFYLCDEFKDIESHPIASEWR
jgi:hypothetical protein